MEPTRTYLKDAYREPEASECLNEESNWLNQFRRSLSWIKSSAKEPEQDLPNELVAE